jgi:hypothetical protein
LLNLTLLGYVDISPKLIYFQNKFSLIGCGSCVIHPFMHSACCYIGEVNKMIGQALDNQPFKTGANDRYSTNFLPLSNAALIAYVNQVA